LLNLVEVQENEAQRLKVEVLTLSM